MSSFLNHYPDIQRLQSLARRQKRSVYVVGGFVRDMLVNHSSTDIDFTVDRKAVVLARQFADKIKGAFVLLDEEQGCARVVKRSPNEVLTYDFADFRQPTLRRDLNARDYTINTFYADLMKIKPGDALRQHVHGSRNAFDDLEKKTIRMLSPSVLDDDPLRVMRAYSLQAQFGFKIESSTRKEIKARAHLINTVAPERMRDELFKVLRSQRTAKTLKAMWRVGLLERVIPQIHVMFDVPQGGYHHLDVWHHSLEVVHQFERLIKPLMQKDDVIRQYFTSAMAAERNRLALTKLGCLLHDIGKPETRKLIDGRMRFHGHEHVGRNITVHIGKQLKLSAKERRSLEAMVDLHLRPGYLSNFKNPSAKMIYRFFRDAGDEAISILLLSLADQRSTRGPMTTQAMQDHHEHICLSMVHRYIERQQEEPFIPLLNGRDVMTALRLTSSPSVGQVLRAVNEQQALGQIKTKKQALDYIKQYWRKKES